MLKDWCSLRCVEEECMVMQSGRDSGLGFCLCFLVSPGLTQVPEPAECLVSGVYNLIRLPGNEDAKSCYQHCFDEPKCHMAVVSKPLSGAHQCLLVNCLNQGSYRVVRDPSAEITVYPKSTIDDEQRAFLMKGAYGWADEKLRCSGLMKDSSCDSKSPRFFYNKNTRGCEQVTSGCGSNRNTFDTRGACETFCNERRVCYLPVEYGENPSAGHSGGPHIRAEPDAETIRGKPDANAPYNFFFHNMSSFRCEGFHFRGSASNGNIFSTVEECESHCGDVKARCFDFMEDRSCKPRFFYNSTSYRCEQLSSGGCGSNKNAFDTRDGCEALCNEKYRCYRPVEHGQRPSMYANPYSIKSEEPDKDSSPNFFFYNISSLKCEGFHFRGRGSNGNIFRTVEECERLCGDVKDPVPAQNTATTTSPTPGNSDTTAVVPTERADISVTPSVPAQNTATTTSPTPVDSDTTAVVPTERAVTTTRQSAVGSDNPVTPPHLVLAQNPDPVPAQNTGVSAPESVVTAAIVFKFFLAILFVVILGGMAVYFRTSWCPPNRYTLING
ncbi:papilin-like [Centropristis striata]|uniref:papilin-like n=1 Tax=Centropristis striata TaxID=184440 RepID=UPI0027E1D08C|nr:papilin-like [Centropristis striata]